MDIPTENITLRSRNGNKDQTGKPVKIDYSNTISWNSTAEIGNIFNQFKLKLLKLLQIQGSKIAKKIFLLLTRY